MDERQQLLKVAAVTSSGNAAAHSKHVEPQLKKQPSAVVMIVCSRTRRLYPFHLSLAELGYLLTAEALFHGSRMITALDLPVGFATLCLAMQRLPPQPLCLTVQLSMRLCHCCQQQGTDESGDFLAQPACRQVKKIRLTKKVAGWKPGKRALNRNAQQRVLHILQGSGCCPRIAQQKKHPKP